MPNANITEKLAPLAVLASFASWPFLSFLGHNAAETYYYDRIFFSWIGFLAAVLALGQAIMFLFRDNAALRIRFSFAFGVFVIAFFSYQPISDALLLAGLTWDMHRVAAWAAVSVAALAWTWRLASHPAWRQALLTALAVMMIIPVFQLARQMSWNMMASANAKPQAAAKPASVQNRRNVYWILTDAYERADILRDVMGLDTSGFLAELNDQGFAVGHDSFANYPKTKFSIAATLSGDYMLPDRGALAPALIAPKLQGYNWTVDTFRQMGYRYIHAEAGGGMLKTRCGGAEDRCITGRLQGRFSISEAEAGLIQLTPLFPLLKRSRSKAFIFGFNDAHDLIQNLRIKSETPFFLFAHILSPHPPARFNKDCSRIIAPDWKMKGYHLESYTNDVRCLNGQLLQLIDFIRDNDKTDPIIIISADHGHTYVQAVNDQSRPSGYADGYLRTIFGILMAMRLPNECRQHFYPSITPVNQFRLTFACLQGREPDFVKDRYFLPEGEDNVQEIELPKAPA